MVSLLTENQISGYKSKILEASIVKDPERKMIYIDADAPHKQIEKQMRKRHMIKLRTGSVNSYVANQVKK